MTFPIEGISVRERDERPLLLVAGAWEDQRPFQGLLAHADWFLAGRIHRLARRDWLSGREGEHRLFLGLSALSHAGLAVVGLGAIGAFDEKRLLAFQEHARTLERELGGPEMVFELPFVLKDVPREAIDPLFERSPTWQIVSRTPSGRIVPVTRGKPSVRPRES